MANNKIRRRILFCMEDLQMNGAAGVEDCVHYLGELGNSLPYVKNAKSIVASDIAVFREQVQGGVNGMLVDLDAEKFVLAIVGIFRY